MKIKTKIRAGILLYIVMTVTIGLFIFMAIQKMNNESQETISAAKIVKDVAELKIVMHEYLLHPEERSLIQWKSKYNFLSKSLIRDKNKFEFQDEKTILSKIHQNLMEIGIVFEEFSTRFGKKLRNDRQKDISLLKLKNRLTGELLVKSQVMIPLVFQLQRIIQAEVMAIQQFILLLIAAFLVMSVFIVAVTLVWVNSSVAKPIAKLEEGTRIIGSGNLNHKVGTDAKDEIGQLSRAFDKMTMDLKKTTTSIDGLRKEIVERKKAEDALLESEERFRALHNASFGGITIHDKGLILECNKGLSEITGYDYNELIGMDGLSLISEDTRDKVIQNINAGYEKSYEAKGVRKDGQIYPIRLEAKNIPYKKKKVRVVEFRDITEIKRFEKEKLKLEAQLQQAQKMESIGTLAGGIAHDFNNILFPILGYADMLLADIPEDSPFRDSLNEIYTSALRAKALVKQILTFSRQDTNELILMKMQPVVKEALKLIRSTIPTTIDIKQDIRSDCGVIKADPTQIHQIIINLSTNAYHAMEETGGELKVSLKEIELGEHDVTIPDMIPGVYACLAVADTGMGMDKDVTEKIFDPFFTTKEIGKGTGMGLSVVHGIVKSMGGSIHVYSEPGKGTEFKVYFPIEKSLSEEQNIQTEEPVQGGTERILFVDDEETILIMEKRILERLGYQVTSRTSSIEALEAFRTNPDTFDMVITDMAMPNMPGDKLAVELTKIRPDIPVLLCTGFSETMSKEKAASLGINGFLLKPIVMKDLAIKIREVLGEN